MEQILNPYHFSRIHQSHLINLNHLKKYSKKDGGTVKMIDGTILPVSKRKKKIY
ncbi:MAG: LytTR family transcriptional regulator DNA-binding domain-containing protein [Flavobacteriales bacterium]